MVLSLQLAVEQYVLSLMVLVGEVYHELLRDTLSLTYVLLAVGFHLILL